LRLDEVCRVDLSHLEVLRMENNSSPKGPVDLRKRAEESLKSGPDKSGDTRLEEANSLIHELRIHQVELEMQNSVRNRNYSR
jgi:hypothetical protein